MPNTKPSLDTVFCEAISIDDPVARAAYTKRSCGYNSELYQRVEALVAAHFKAGSFLAEPANAVDTDVHTPSTGYFRLDAATPKAGSTIGPYKLREILGEGGMGSVFVAEQEKPVRRKVALKVIKPGMGSREVISRFESERQALAMMNHPNIARVLDAGTTDGGLPYFVMELVKGTPITELCDTHKLGTRERLDLFLQVCQAIHHAHQKGIIHRDIKPSNVLVAVHDVTLVVKVIDFGVAKALGQQLTDNTLYTALSQMVGTPLYMSPEQAGQSSLDIDTRSDVYSLGVLLYELLTGNTPFDKEVLKQAGFDEMRRIIREVEPPRPSARVSTLNAEAQSTVAGQRQIEPRKLSQQFRGELDWIVMKAIEKDRNRRYDSATSFAADVQRFLDDLPVEASPPSIIYRIRKLAKRHRVGLFTSAALLCMMVVATVLSARFAIVATQALADSEGNRKTADAQRTIAELQQKEASRLQHEAVAQRNATQQALYRADIRLAGIDHRDVNALRLHQSLKAQFPVQSDPDMRAWEWYYLLGASHQETSSILGHRSEVEDVAWSPDGKRIASIGGYSIRICDASSGALIYENDCGCPTIGGAWSRDSRRFAWGSESTDNTIRIWDSLTNNAVSLRGHTWSLRGVCWSPDGRRLLSASRDGTCRIWDIDTHECLFVVANETGPWNACWHPTHEYAAIATDEGVLIINPTSAEIVTKTSEDGSVRSVAFSTDGTKLIMGCNTGRCIIRDVDSWKVLLDFQAHKNGVSGIAANPKYPSFATCGGDGVTHIWRLADGRKHSTLFGHDGSVNGVDWDPTGLRLVTGSSDQKVLMWDISKIFTFHRISLATANASAISWDSDSSLIRCTMKDGSVVAIDIATNKVIPSALQEDQVDRNMEPKSASLANYLQSSGYERTNKQKQFFFDSNKEGILWTTDESKVAAITQKNAIEIWDAQEKLRVFNMQVASVNYAEWAPDHHRLAIAGGGARSQGLEGTGWVYIMDSLFGGKDQSLRLGFASELATAIGWNPSGTRIVAGNSTGLACIWDTADFKLLKSHVIHQAQITSLAWSPDAKRIASADSQGQVKILDSETLEELLTLNEGAGGDMKQLAWSPDGRQLAGIHKSGSVVVWNANRGFEFSKSQELEKQIASQNGKVLMQEAEFHFRKNDYDSAIKVLDQLLQADEKYPGAVLFRGLNLFYHSRFALAYQDFVRAVELDPREQRAWNWLGMTQSRLGQFDEAIHSLTVAYDENPETGRDPRTHRAIAYILCGDDEKGKSELKLISDSYPTSYASNMLAHLYVSLGELEAYRELCKRMNHSSPNGVVKACVLGPNAVADFVPLIETAQKLQNESPTELWYAENYGSVLYRAGRFEEALQQFVKSCERAVRPTSMNLSWYLRAMTYKQLNRENEAIEWLEKADAAADTLFALGYQVDWEHRVAVKTFQKEARELIRGSNP